MREVHVFGEIERHRPWIEQKGWSLASGATNVKNALVCTFDNESSDPLDRLRGTIETMREAMDALQPGVVERVVLVTDGSGYAGTRQISRAPASATFNDAHGLGSLTAEVLAQLARKAGAKVTIVHGSPATDEHVRARIFSAFVQS